MEKERRELVSVQKTRSDKPDPVGESVGSKVNVVLTVEGICMLHVVNKVL